MTYKLIASVFGCALVAAAGWLYQSPKNIPSAPSPTDSSARQDELQKQLSELASRVRQLQITQPEQAANPPALVQKTRPEASVEHREVSPAVVDPEEHQRKQEERTQQRFGALARSFETEPMDPGWAQPAQQALQAAYQTREFEGAKIDAACKSTFCRLTVNLSGVGEPHLAARMLAMRGPWSAPSLFKIDTVAHQVEYYVAREEFELPRADDLGLEQR